MKECQECFMNNKTTEGEIITFRCELRNLEIKVDSLGDWDYCEGQKFKNILKSSIEKGCEKYQCKYL